MLQLYYMFLYNTQSTFHIDLLQHVRSSLGFGSQKMSRQSENSYVIGGTSSDMNMIRTRLKSEYVHSAQARIP